jgi:hypothetical protein
MLRVATTLPDALPLNGILRDLALVPASSQEAEAGRRLLDRWHMTSDRLNAKSYAARYADYVTLGARDFQELSDVEADSCLRAAHSLSEYAADMDGLNDLYFSLIALAALITGMSREELTASLTSGAWHILHEVITRHAWMHKHRQLIAENKGLESPFECLVARRERPRQRHCDVEFFTLLRFLHGLRAETGDELVLAAKNETPDFILEDSKGARFGAEISEVYASVEGGFEAAAEDKVVNCLASLERFGVRVVINEPPRWRTISKHLPQLVCWRDTELIQAAHEGKRVSRIHSSGLTVELEPLASPYTVVASFHGGQELANAEAAFSEALYEAVKNKLWKENGNPRKPPSVTPCYLVLYPNVTLANLDSAVRLFRERPALDIGKYFSQVWLASERLTERIA